MLKNANTKGKDKTIYN